MLLALAIHLYGMKWITKRMKSTLTHSNADTSNIEQLSSNVRNEFNLLLFLIRLRRLCLPHIWSVQTQSQFIKIHEHAFSWIIENLWNCKYWRPTTDTLSPRRRYRNSQLLCFVRANTDQFVHKTRQQNYYFCFLKSHSIRIRGVCIRLWCVWTGGLGWLGVCLNNFRAVCVCRTHLHYLLSILFRLSLW